MRAATESRSLGVLDLQKEEDEETGKEIREVGSCEKETKEEREETFSLRRTTKWAFSAF